MIIIFLSVSLSIASRLLRMSDHSKKLASVGVVKPALLITI